MTPATPGAPSPGHGHPAKRRGPRRVVLDSPRARRAHVEAQRDYDFLLWISRFRFVTADLLALRFEVSVQQARARLRWLERERLVQLHRAHVGTANAAVLTSRGRAALGQDRRVRPPRVDVHRTHELAIVELVAHMELAMDQAVTVLTERECRRREAEDPRVRFSVAVRDGHGRASRRWPDVVLIAPDGSKTAIEIEFSPKSTDRLNRIVRGYLASPLAEVRFLVASASLATRLRRIASRMSHSHLTFDDNTCRIVIDAWDGADDAEKEAIRNGS